MMLLIALLIIANFVVVFVVATKASSSHFLVKDINYKDLISGDLSSADVRRTALQILEEDGIIALSDIPGLAEAREDAFTSSAKCIFTNIEQQEKIAPVELTLEDGSTRYSWGAQVNNKQEEPMIPFTPLCPELQSKMETLREIVDRASLVFGQLLDNTIVYKDFDQGLFSSVTKGVQYSSFQQVIQNGKHLDHFHVYKDDASTTSAHMKKRTLELHTDQGLFIGFIPSIQVLDNGRFIIQSKEDRLVMETKQTRQVSKVKFPHDGNVLVFMIGEGINLVKRNSIIQSLRPLPHALERASSLNQDGQLRAWFGRMFFPPSDAIIPGTDETFESFMIRIRNTSINNDLMQRNNILSLACDHSPLTNAQGAMQQSRLLQDATGNDCSAGEVYCWMSCLPIDALPCDKDSIICQKQNGQIWEPCDTCHDPTSKLVCSTNAPTPSQVVHREFDIPLGLLHLWFSANGTHAKFRLQGSERGYIGFGLGSIMISSLAIIGMDPTANSQDVPVGIYRIVDLVGTRDKLAVTSAQLLSYGIVDSSFQLVPGGSELEFTVDPSKQNPQFPIIGDKVDIIYAQGPLLYEEHYAFGNKRNLNFSTGASIGDSDDNEDDDGGVDGYYLVNPTLAGHIVLMIFAWEVFAPIGILFPLFNNKARFGLGAVVPKWFKYHWVGQTIAVIVGYVGILLGYLSVESKRKPHWSTTHKIIGLVVLLLSIIQPLAGHFRPHKPQHDDDPPSPTDDHRRKSNRARKAFEIFHPLLGYFLLFLAMANAFLGVEELFETSGRQAFYSFTKGGPLMETGFSGPLGIAVICLFALFSFIIVIGWTRILLRGKRAKTDKTAPKATVPEAPPATTSEEEEEEQSAAHELVKTDSFMALAQA